MRHKLIVCTREHGILRRLNHAQLNQATHGVICRSQDTISIRNEFSLGQTQNIGEEFIWKRLGNHKDATARQGI